MRMENLSNMVGSDAKETGEKLGSIDSISATNSLVMSHFPVEIPHSPELFYSDNVFNAYINTLSAPNSTSERVKRAGEDATQSNNTVESPFMEALMASEARYADTESLAIENKMLTDNGDVAFKGSGNPILDLYIEIRVGLGGEQMRKLLEAAWEEDAESTLKLIFHARSIHIGKGEQKLAYRAFGWLYQNHPRTFLSNLKWLVTPVVEKKAAKEDTDYEHQNQNQDKEDNDDDDEMVLVEAPKTRGEEEPLANTTVKLQTTSEQHDYLVKYGGSHGYWKDLLNILALAANDQLRPDGDPFKVLNIQRQRRTPQDGEVHEQDAKRRKLDKLSVQHERLIQQFSNDPTYKALHLTVAREFAHRLRYDLELLKSGVKKDLRAISLAGKWAPSPKESHDKQTFIVSSIAEILYPHDMVCPDVPKTDRGTYLKYAREAFRRLTLSPLRKHLAIVERDISANAFDRIKYDRVPSKAMDFYQKLFVKKDFDRFESYIDRVAEGKAQISGAILLPQLLVHRARTMNKTEDAQGKIREKVLDGQWKTLVQRIRDARELQSSLGVCDTSLCIRLSRARTSCERLWSGFCKKHPISFRNQ